MKEIVPIALILLAFVACSRHEESLTGTYGNGFISGEVQGPGGASAEGITVSVAGTGMSMVTAADGRFAFGAVPEDARLHFFRADGIDASLAIGGNTQNLIVEVNGNSATTSARRRPSTPLLQFEGTIVSVGASSLTVFTSHKEEVTVALTSDTIIRKGMTMLTVADLAADQRVHVKAKIVDDVKTAVLVILQEEEGEEEGGDHDSTMTANGIVKSLGDSQLVVLRANGDEVTVNVTADTIIRKFGQMITFADIKVDDRIESRGTRVDDHTMTAVQIEIESAGGNRHGH